MTLIEVLAGLAILSTVLVAILIAKGRYTRQHARAARLTEVVAATDQLLSEQWTDQGIAPGESGPLPGLPDYEWRTFMHAAVLPRELENHARLVRLEVTRADTNNTNNTPILTLDLLTPPEVPPPPEAPEAPEVAPEVSEAPGTAEAASTTSGSGGSTDSRYTGFSAYPGYPGNPGYPGVGTESVQRLAIRRGGT